MDEKVISILKDKPVVIPRILLNNYKKLNISDSELIIIMVLLSFGDKITYNPEEFAKEINGDKHQVMNIINNLIHKNIISLEIERVNKKANEFKEEDGILYAIYGTPAESLAGLQVEQFRKKYGIIEGVSDRAYVSNSFHCGVWEDITPIQKQDAERNFWNLFNGGKIQYCRYPISYNKEAVKTLVRRAMDFGFYEGINLSLAYCEECGYEELDMDVCPKCGSKLITKIDRMNGLSA